MIIVASLHFSQIILTGWLRLELFAPGPAMGLGGPLAWLWASVGLWHCLGPQCVPGLAVGPGEPLALAVGLGGPWHRGAA